MFLLNSVSMSINRRQFVGRAMAENLPYLIKSCLCVHANQCNSPDVQNVFTEMCYIKHMDLHIIPMYVCVCV